MSRKAQVMMLVSPTVTPDYSTLQYVRGGYRQVRLDWKVKGAD